MLKYYVNFLGNGITATEEHKNNILKKFFHMFDTDMCFFCNKCFIAFTIHTKMTITTVMIAI